MKTIICGGRSYRLTTGDYAALESIRHSITMVVSGGAAGVDRDAEAWAARHGITRCICRAQWDTISGGMLAYAQACIAFQGGDGTDAIVAAAQRQGLLVLDWRGKSRDASALDLL